ncbi:DUF6075 family protein [Heyndrickxia sp. FSL W8-0423]|uniref:DUF6075 family protein n=1 Tax=Heyndrickxia sp. FSL W8-0423 TaxID=2921601 RepID=UPI0030F61D7F
MFMFPNHKDNYECLLGKDGTHPNDIERKSLFYIFAGNEEIMKQVNLFYDFQERMIKIDNDRASISSGARALVLLGYNLYNNYPSWTISELFRNLDRQNSRLAFQAIKIRFRITEQ